MSAVSQLIDVSYTDLTNYTESAGGDVYGSPMEHHWGPVGKLTRLNEVEFFRNYPNSLPIGSTYVNPQRYYAYAQAKRAFECGIKEVEIFRILGDWKYSEVYIKSIVGSDNALLELKQSDKQFAALGTNALAISLKYPGIPPKSLIGRYDRLALVVSADAATQVVDIKVCGAVEYTSTGNPKGLYISEDAKKFEVDVDAPLEEFTGSTDPSAMEDGASFFIESVVKSSDFIVVSVNPEKKIPNDIPDTAVHILSVVESDETKHVAVPDSDSSDLIEEYGKAIVMFDDMMVSSATLLVSPIATDDLDNDVIKVAKSRQDLNGVIGYPTGSTFSKESINSWFNTKVNGIRNMFSFLVVGREKTSVFGYPIITNCVGGWCGHTSNVAETERTNQLASAFTYGDYNGSVSESLTFDEVCELHKLGINSVFISNQGPLIWGVRSLHKKQTSYWGKANVIRVLSKVLRQIFPICLNAIHTDAASNPLTRADYNIQFNRVLGDEIARQNLASDSYADCLGDINSDVNTKGGTIFNLVLSLHFFGLTEKFNIRVYATDSSVTAEIV